MMVSAVAGAAFKGLQELLTMRFPPRLFRALLAGLILATTSAGAARADPPVWRAHGEHAEITLFGSVHLLSAATAWKTLTLQRALAQADQIWFEVAIDNAATLAAGRDALRLGMLPQDQTLTSLLDPTTRDRVRRLAVSDGLEPAAVDRMKPWLAELLLTTFYFTKHGAEQSLGVEQQISKDAPASAVREAFETVDEQLHLFADDPLPDQIASLKQTLDEIDDDPTLFNRLVGAWARGDTNALVKEVITPTRRDTPGVYARLIVDRNRRFAARLEQLLKGSGHILIVVGVGHLVGPDSVPSMLRRDGVAVDGP